MSFFNRISGDRYLRRDGPANNLENENIDKALNLPEAVREKFVAFYDLAAEHGYDSAEAQDFLRNNEGCHPDFRSIAEGMKLMHDEWKKSVKPESKKRPPSGPSR